MTLMLTKIHSNYRKLIEKNKNLLILGSAEAIINWDMETMMPPKAVNLRSEQLALLSQIHHKMSTSPQIGKLLSAIYADPQYDILNELEKRNIYLIKKNYDEQTKLPTKLVMEITKQQAIAVNVWKKAKATRNYALFRPQLEKLVALDKESAQIFMQIKETKTPYDALIDIYEPKMTSATLSKIFDELEEGLKELLSEINKRPQNQRINLINHKVPIEKQRAITKILVQTLGYDVTSANAAGRVDETEHPFTTGYYDDVRITTHYHQNNIISSIFSVLHETGHALYEQGLPERWKYEPIGAPCSMGFHESQSRLFENIIGRSREFWTALLPKITKNVAPELLDISLDSFIEAINTVQPSKIRIEADEVSYNLHIIIRFQIESELFSDKISVKELPTVWNQKYEELLGVHIENDAEGVLQDTHWASGLYGYFPTYTLGNIYTGQLLKAMNQNNPEWCDEVAQGNLTFVRKWLRENLYNYGNLFDPQELVKKATGTELTVKPYLDYLIEKFQRRYLF
jgi:carboxypeptidase Taq